MIGPQDPVAEGGSDRRQFHMRSCLGRGGFGEVYRATMVSAGGVTTDVAVKVLHAEVDPTSQAVQRLRDEGKLLGAVHHPSVLKVFDLVVLEGRVALVTEYVDGQDLDKCMVGSDPLPLRALVEVTGRVSEALDAAWNAPSPMGAGPLHLVHRDVKPANIRIGQHGEVKLLDFGIARAQNVGREARTETNAMLGSFLYMAPERFLEETDLEPASDVFSLGCAIFEGVAHKRLFGEMALRDLYLLVLDPARFDAFVRTQLDALPIDTPKGLIRLLRSMLAVDPRRRPAPARLARACYDLAETMDGNTLDRWARRRNWPSTRTVQGMLDGSVITEGNFSRSGRFTTDFTDEVEAVRAPRPAPSGSSTLEEYVDEGAISAVSQITGQITGVVRRPLFGLGIAALLSMGGGMLLASAVLAAGVYAVLSRPDPAVDVTEEIQFAPPELVTEPEAPATPEPMPVEPEPEPEPEPVAVAPRPRPRPRPAPQPAAAPAPAPAPAPAGDAVATLTVKGGVLVEFRGAAGTFRAGRVPEGTYDIYANFGDGMTRAGTVHVTRGQSTQVMCGKLRRECKVVP